MKPTPLIRRNLEQDQAHKMLIPGPEERTFRGQAPGTFE